MKAQKSNPTLEIAAPTSDSPPRPPRLSGESEIRESNSDIPPLNPEPQTRHPSPRGGPRTPEGKARSRLNALKHGLTATLPVILPGEDPDNLQTLAESMRDDLQPASAFEGDLVEHLISIAWRRRRIPAIEADLYRQHNETLRQNGQPPPPITDASPARIISAYLTSATDKTDPLARLHRHESSLKRDFDKTLAQLRQLQASRAQNELAPDSAVKSENL